MEISSNIWHILTTENIMLTKIIVAPTIFIESFIIFDLFTSILKINYNKQQKITYIIVFSLITLISEFTVPSPYNVFINYFLLFITLKLIFKPGSIKCILSIIIPTLIFALMSTLLLKPTLELLKISSNTLENTPIYKLLYLLLLYIFMFIVKYFFYLRNFSIDLLDDIDRKNKFIIFINLFFGILTFCVQAVLTYYYVTFIPVSVSILNFILLCSYFFLSFYSLTRIIKLHMAMKNLESAENYNNTLTYLYDNVRAFKHDFDNMVFIIGGFINQNDINGLKDYYKNLEKDCERVNNMALLSPKLINNSGIYNLLISKYKKAFDSNVEIKLDFFFDLNKLNMPLYDFSRILGILLDNAIEAASESLKKQVYISFRDSSVNNTQIVSIKNTYSNNVDTSEIFQKGKTTKKNHTGMGLWEVNQILKRNPNVHLDTNSDNDYFKQTLEIYY